MIHTVQRFKLHNNRVINFVHENSLDIKIVRVCGIENESNGDLKTKRQQFVFSVGITSNLFITCVVHYNERDYGTLRL